MRGRERVDERRIVRHRDDRPRKIRERRLERAHRFEVEVVRRLVDDEQLRARQQRADHRDARVLAAAQRMRGRAGVDRQAGVVERRAPALGEVPAPVERAEVVFSRVAARDALERRERRVEMRDGGGRATWVVCRAGVVLRDERDRRMPVDRTRRRREPARDQVREHALADAVAAGDRGRRAIEREVERIKQRDAVVEAEGNAMDRDERGSGCGSGHEHLRKWVATFARRARDARSATRGGETIRGRLSCSLGGSEFVGGKMRGV